MVQPSTSSVSHTPSPSVSDSRATARTYGINGVAFAVAITGRNRVAAAGVDSAWPVAYPFIQCPNTWVCCRIRHRCPNQPEQSPPQTPNASTGCRRNRNHPPECPCIHMCRWHPARCKCHRRRTLLHRDPSSHKPSPSASAVQSPHIPQLRRALRSCRLHRSQADCNAGA